MSEKFLSYVTTPTYYKLQDISKETGMYNYSNMVWDKDIYEANLESMETIFEQDNLKIQRLKLPNYIHFFAVVEKNDEFKPLLFWLNIISDKEEKNINLQNISTYNTRKNFLHKLIINEKIYTAIYAGHVALRYSMNYLNAELSSESVSKLHAHVQEYINGEKTDVSFRFTNILDVIIVYRVKI